MTKGLLRPAIVAAAAITLGACTHGGYGYTGLSVGVGNGYYYDRNPYYGWYDGYYYPGSGYYVYDRSGYRHRWSPAHRRYWESRRGQHHRGDNWSGYGVERRDGRHWRGGEQQRRGDWNRGDHDRGRQGQAVRARPTRPQASEHRATRMQTQRAPLRHREDSDGHLRRPK
jgi:hypothetical protein